MLGMPNMTDKLAEVDRQIGDTWTRSDDPASSFARVGERCGSAERRAPGRAKPKPPCDQARRALCFVACTSIDHGQLTRAEDMNAQNSSRLTVHTPSINVIVPVWSEYAGFSPKFTS